MAHDWSKWDDLMKEVELVLDESNSVMARIIVGSPIALTPDNMAGINFNRP